MSCRRTPGLSTHQLLNYLDGEAESDVVAHVTQCHHCQQRVWEIARIERNLHKLFTKSGCPSATVLEQYYLGELTPLHETVIARHLATECVHCQAAVAAFMEQLASLAPQSTSHPATATASWR